MAVIVIRWVLALPIALLIFLPLLFLSWSLVLWIFSHLGVHPDATKSSAIPAWVLAFAPASFVSIGVGAAVAPHHYWRLAVGILSTTLLVPAVASCIQDILVTGEAGFGGRDFDGILGVAVGAFVAYQVLRRQWKARFDSPALSGRATLAILVAYIVLLLLPLRSVTVPQWRVQFVDAQERPLTDLKIKQNWASFTGEGQIKPWEEIRTTDANGFVVFPERVLWAPLALHLWGSVRDVLRIFKNTYLFRARYANLTPLCPLRAVEHGRVLYVGESRLAGQVHLVEADGANGAYDPSCQRLLDQVQSAQNPH